MVRGDDERKGEVMPGQQWHIGNRIYEEDWRMYGTVIDVDDYGGDWPVITVLWDDLGSVSDFTPDEQTRKASPCTTTT